MIRTDYSGLGKLEHLFAQQGIPVLTMDYGADVAITILVPPDHQDAVWQSIVEQTNGLAKQEWGADTVYAQLGRELIVF